MNQHYFLERSVTMNLACGRCFWLLVSIKDLWNSELATSLYVSFLVRIESQKLLAKQQVNRIHMMCLNFPGKNVDSLQCSEILWKDLIQKRYGFTLPLLRVIYVSCNVSSPVCRLFLVDKCQALPDMWRFMRSFFWFKSWRTRYWEVSLTENGVKQWCFFKCTLQ